MALRNLTDLYRGKTFELSIGRYLFYLSFFLHVVAGPIVRTWQLIPQLRITRTVAADWAMGFHFLVTGFFSNRSAPTTSARS